MWRPFSDSARTARTEQLPLIHPALASTLLFTLVATPGCNSQGSGAGTLKELEKDVVSAVAARDLHGAQSVFLDASAYIKACPDKFNKRSEARFKQKVANGRRRFATQFHRCEAMAASGSITVQRRRGGMKLRQVKGCGESAWEYDDVTLDVTVAGRNRRITIDGIMGINGRYYVVERISCR